MAEPTSSPKSSSVTSESSHAESRPSGANTIDDSTYARFADTYESLNRVIHSLQREYLALKREFDQRTSELVDLNQRLLQVSSSQTTFGETLTSIFQSVGLGIIVVDSDSMVTHINDAACRVLGVGPTQAIGAQYESISKNGSILSAAGSREQRGQSERPRHYLTSDRTIVRPDGSTLVVSSSITLLRTPQGEVSGVVEAIQDLTSVRRLESEIARLKTLAAMGEMAAGIAHEVRNPLAAIGGFAALLERDLEGDDNKRQLTSKIMQGVETLNQTVTRILDYTRLEELQLQMVELRGFLQQSIDSFLHEEGAKDWQIEIQLEPLQRGVHEPRLSLDFRLMRQVMHNLLRNAAEAMKHYGKITVRYERLSHAAATSYADSLMLAGDEAMAVISISDNGPGIAPEVAERLFFPLITTKAKGTGLGLAMALKLVQAHGGEIVVESPPTGGAIFRLLLPMKISHGS